MGPCSSSPPSSLYRPTSLLPFLLSLYSYPYVRLLSSCRHLPLRLPSPFLLFHHCTSLPLSPPVSHNLHHVCHPVRRHHQPQFHLSRSSHLPLSLPRRPPALQLLHRLLSFHRP